jgi:hypothetical protein
MMNSGTGAKWVPYFHPFPLSLFLSLIIWLDSRASRGPVRYAKKWLTAFFVSCVPGGVLYGFIVNVSLSLPHLEPTTQGMTTLVLLVFEAIAFFLLCLQVLFAFLAFSSGTNESSERMHDQV